MFSVKKLTLGNRSKDFCTKVNGTVMMFNATSEPNRYIATEIPDECPGCGLKQTTGHNLMKHINFGSCIYRKFKLKF